MKEKFSINISPDVLDDLHRRLSATRWTNQIDNDKWEVGTNLSYLKELCDYWQNEFDWKKQEAYLNSFNHYKTKTDDFDLHFIYQEGSGKTTVPLLLTHGYPDGFIRFHKLIPLLTKENEKGFSFDVVVPSIPGYGFSGIPNEKGMNPKRIAELFNKLMTYELGYDKYVAHGGDWGTSITEQIALYHEQSLLGIHLTDVPFGHLLLPLKNLTAKEKKLKKKNERWIQTEGAYASIQSTKPQSLAYGLNDSPAGLAAWIIEKFFDWSDNKGNIEDAFTKDELLTNITIYWVTQTIYSSFHLYYETIQALMQAQYNPLVKLNPFDKTGNRPGIPAAFAIFPKDISQPPREYAERFFNVQRWTEMPHGGHFAALEEPELLADDILQFAHTLRS